MLPSNDHVKMTFLILLVAVLPTYITAYYSNFEENCFFNVDPVPNVACQPTHEQLSCKPSHVQCVGKTNFTLCVNTLGLTVMLNKIYSCPDGYDCYDNEKDVACLLKPGSQGEPKLPLPPELAMMVPMLQNLDSSVPRPLPSESVTWPETTKEAPTIVPGIRNEVHVQPGEDVTIICGVTGTPSPSITWLRNGIAITNYNKKYIQNPDQTLTILDADKNDQGTFECRAENGVGNPVYNYVHVAVVQAIENPPVFSQQGQTVIIPCDNYVKPDSRVKWTRDGVSILNDDKHRINNDYSLIILDGALTDSGNYICTVTDENGLVRVTTSTVIMLPQETFSPPQRLHLRTEEIGCLHGSVTLHCPIIGNPTPQIIWLRGSLPINNDNLKIITNEDQSLTINSLDGSDSDTYYCTGDNNVGKPATVEIQLTTSYCKSLHIDINFNPNVVVPLGENTLLNCGVTGVPPPKVTWYRNGYIINGNDPRYILREDQKLEIREAKEEDHGVWQCSASNGLGPEIPNEVNVNVVDPDKLVAPILLWNLFKPNVSGVLGEPLTLNCPTVGNPKPIIIWTKHGQQVNLDDPNYKINPDQTLTIQSANLVDSGEWSCMAINNIEPSIEGRIKVQIDAQKVPTIDETYHKEIYGREYELLVIPCGATGHPTPHITWMKEGQPIQAGFLSRYKVDDLQRLVIAELKLEDKGRYTCIAKNTLGQITNEIDVSVYRREDRTPSTIDESCFSPLESGVLGESITLNCSIIGNPTPTIKWYRHNFPIDGSNANAVINDDQTLTLLNLHPDDAGLYRCTGNNGVGGPLTNEIDVEVEKPDRLQPPTLVLSLLKAHIDGELGSEVLLVCPVNGKPRPKVKWLRHGHVVNSNDPRYTIYSNQTLKIKPLLEKDRGGWLCVANNGVGSPIAVHTVVKVVYPTENEEPLNLDFVVADVIRVPCPVNSHNIIWLKDTKIFIPNRPDIYTDPNTNTLVIPNAQIEDAGSYICADNTPGTENPMVSGSKVTVSQPPETDPTFNPNIDSVLGGSVILNCSVIGNPTPKITWTRGGKPIINRRHQFVINRDQSLLILDVRKHNAGQFECTADNGIGLPLKNTINLSVYEPLQIDFSRYVKDVFATVDEKTILDCAIVGYPKPIINWTRNNVPVDPYDQRFFIDQQAGTLTIANTQLDDRGIYRCFATNGPSNKQLDFFVAVQERHVPPTKDPSANPNKEVNEGDTAFLTCPVTGNPLPSIIWYKKEQRITPDSYHIIHPNHTLEIRNAMNYDEGTYTCVANNGVGQPLTTHMLLTVQATQMHHTRTFLMVPSNTKVILSCDTKFNIDTVWTINGHQIDNNVAAGIHIHESLTIDNIKPSDEGLYACSTNGNFSHTEYKVIVEQHEKPDNYILETVKEGSDLTLNCNFPELSPRPYTWMVGNEIITQNSLKYTLNPDNTLTVKNAEKSDEGKYTCINLTDEIKNNFLVSVEPAKSKSRVVFVPSHVGSDVTLVCTSDKKLSYDITWEKDGIPIDYNDPQVSVNSDQSLTIRNSQRLHQGRYACYSNNEEINKFLVVPIEHGVGPQTTTPPNQVVAVPSPVGSTVLLNCSIVGDIVWTKGNKPVVEDYKHSLQQNGVLKIRDVKKSDIGKYVCRRKDDESKNDEFILTIDNSVPSKMQQPTVTVYLPSVPLDSKLILSCAISGPLSGPVTWYKGNEEIDTNSYKYRLGQNQNLEVRNVDPSDNGAYYCKRKNSDGTVEINQILVRVESDSKYIPGNVIVEPVERYTSVNLSCGANPEDIVTWYKENIPVIPDFNSKIYINPDQTLFINSVDQEDAGSYSCILQNPFEGWSTINFYKIVVYDKNDIPKQNASLVMPAASSHITLPKLSVGSTITLNCGLKKPVAGPVHWFKDDQQLTQTETYKINMDYSLDIFNANVHDSGTYYCESKDEDGHDILDSFVISIEQRGSHPAGHVVVMPAYIGNMLFLQCSAGTPLTVHWTHNNKNVYPNNVRTHIDKQGAYRIDKIKQSDAGTYVCTADGGLLRNRFIIVVPSITNVKKPVTVPTKVGSSVILKCSLKETNTGKIFWNKQGTPIDNRNPDVQVLPDDSLKISNIKKSDAGQYGCTTSHHGTILTNNFILTAVDNEVTPSVSIAVPVQYGKNVNLKCAIPGVYNSVGRVTWTRNNKIINTKDSHIFVKPDQTLQINNVKNQDDGPYICTTQSSKGPVSSALVVTVRGGPKKPLSSITTIQLLKENFPATLVCLLPDEVSDVTWTRDGIKITHDDTNYQINNKILKIVKVHSSDLRRYTCIGETPSGNTVFSNIITVSESPDIDFQGAVPIYLIETIVDHKLIIPCGEPADQSKVIWTKENYVINKFDPKYRIEGDGSLSIPQVDQSDESMYTCTREYPNGTYTMSKVVVLVDRTRLAVTMTLIKPSLPGSDIIMDCGLPGQRLEDVIWTKDNVVINDCNVKYKVFENKSLAIENFKKSDAGRYKCVAKYPNGPGRSYAEFIVTDDTIVSEERIYLAMEIGNYITLQCTSDYNIPSSVSWMKDDNRINPGDSSKTVNPDGSLLIRGVQSSDAGIFKCTDPISGKTKIFVVQIAEDTTPSTRPDKFRSEVIGFRGRTVTLDCGVVGNPPPLVTWTKDGRSINNRDNRFKLNDDQTLEIRDLKICDDGIYYCHAINEYGELTNEISLIVDRDSSPLPVSKSKLIVETGVSVQLDCDINVPQESQLTWTKDSLSIDLYNSRFQLWRDHLEINNIQAPDFGLYRCEGMNYNGQIAIKEIEVIRKDEPATDIISDATQEPSVPAVAYIPLGSSITLDCEIPGNQNNFIKWTKDDTPITIFESARIQVLFNQSLAITDVHQADYGMYSCSGMNMFGQSETKYFNILQKDEPAQDIDSGTNKESSPTIGLIPLGSSITLDCEIPGSQNNFIKWAKDDTPITIFESARIQVLFNQSLAITDIHQADYGMYSCSGMNMFGQPETKYFNILQKDEPVLDIIPDQESSFPTVGYIPLGSSITLDCEIPGNQNNFIKWAKDDTPITIFESARIQVLFNQSLAITDIHQADYGMYSCSGMNMFGQSETKYFNILQKDEVNQDLMPVPGPVPLPGPALPPKILPVDIGTNVGVSCIIPSKDPSRPTVWQKDGYSITSDNRIRFSSNGSVSKITIDHFQPSDYGMYSCSATDVYGQQQKIEYSLVPTVAGRFAENDEPDESPLPHDLVKLPGSQVNLSCPANDICGVMWLRNGLPVFNTTSTHLINSNKEIIITPSTPSDFGTYVCIDIDKQRELIEYSVKNACEDEILKDSIICTQFNNQFEALMNRRPNPPKCEQDVSNLHQLNMLWPAESCTEYYECEPEDTATQTIYVPKLKTCPPNNNFNPDILACQPKYKFSCTD